MESICEKSFFFSKTVTKQNKKTENREWFEFLFNPCPAE